MRIHIQKQQPEFQPIVLSLTITDENEMAVMTTLFGSNCTISERLYSGTPEKQEKCDKMMSDIYVALTQT